jgi:hypothetical protein
MVANNPIWADFGNVTRLTPFIDGFKALFANLTMGRYLHLSVGDCFAGVRASDWFVRMVQKAPFGNWWNGVWQGTGAGNPIMFAKTNAVTWVGSQPLSTVNYGGPTWFDATSDATMEEMKVWKEALTDPTQKNVMNVFTSADAWSSNNGASEVKRSLRDAGYSIPKTQYGATLNFTLYSQDATLVAVANQLLSSMDTYAPADEFATNVSYGVRSDNGDYYTNAMLQQQTGYVTYNQVVRWT